MKKTVKILALAVVALSLTVACKNAPAEEPIDTIDTVAVEEEVIDTIVEEEIVAEETVKTTAKAEEKATGVDASKMTVNTNAGTATIGKKKNTTKQSGIDASEVTLQNENGTATVSTEGKISLKKKN